MEDGPIEISWREYDLAKGEKKCAGPCRYSAPPGGVSLAKHILRLGINGNAYIGPQIVGYGEDSVLVMNIATINEEAMAEIRRGREDES